VPVFLTTTDAAGTAAPEASVIRPEMDAVPACPQRLPIAAKNKTKAAKAVDKRARLRQLLILMVFPSPEDLEF
jgi:hypothetical protein